jgi:hypothetical protein
MPLKIVWPDDAPDAYLGIDDGCRCAQLCGERRALNASEFLDQIEEAAARQAPILCVRKAAVPPPDEDCPTCGRPYLRDMLPGPCACCGGEEDAGCICVGQGE